jgi:hypothetical protein
MESSAEISRKRIEMIERVSKGSYGEVWIARLFKDPD